eukprot:SAG31_NODE_4281_length_3382_cov_3.978373_2_plen_80_part_00
MLHAAAGAGAASDPPREAHLSTAIKQYIIANIHTVSTSREVPGKISQTAPVWARAAGVCINTDTRVATLIYAPGQLTDR